MPGLALLMTATASPLPQQALAQTTPQGIVQEQALAEPAAGSSAAAAGGRGRARQVAGTATGTATAAQQPAASPGAPLGTGGPMSAIDWLSRSVATRPPAGAAATAPQEPPVASSAGHEQIAVTALGDTTLDALGLVPAARAGLPQDFWGGSTTTALIAQIGATRIQTLPALRSLFVTLLTAELDPPFDADGSGQLYLARVDKLLDMGALDPALALLDLPDEPRPEPFRRWFDVALLTGHEDEACAAMEKAPTIAPTFPARIFCLSRNGDWNTAALSLVTGRALGHIDDDTGELLARFLDPELADGAEDLPPPQRPSPLVFRLMEAIGQPQSTTPLPLAFAQADLRPNLGWKTRLDAAERLARAGAIDPNILQGLYTERPPAASGGVWQRVAAIQKLEAALAADDSDTLYEVVPEAWRLMAEAELEQPFAVLYGARLAGLGLKGEAGALAFRAGLLSPDYEQVAAARRPADGTETFLIALARGTVAGTTQPGRLGGAIRDGFAADARLDERYRVLLGQDRDAEALLQAMADIEEGAQGDLRRMSAGLTLLRRMGFESTARQAALQLMLLERRG